MTRHPSLWPWVWHEPQPTILKEADSKAGQLAELEALMAALGVTPEKKAQIERELKIHRAEIKGERESAYDIDFYRGASKNRIVIHVLHSGAA